MLTLLDLLSRGYFPRELPPPFATESFAKVVTVVSQQLPPSFSSFQAVSKLCRHSIAKVGLDRRTLSIPNPIGYHNLGNALAQFWPAIHTFTQQSTI
jgi:hypothetical protein